MAVGSEAADTVAQSVVFDVAAFQHFAPLLQVCRGYAALSGGRFRSADFGPTAAASMCERQLAAQRQAVGAVTQFKQRLCSGDLQLVDELERAYRIVMVESVRNAMQGTFQALDMFPPATAPLCVDDDDCAYEDVSAPLPVVAQRLYNDQVRRLTDFSGGLGRLEMRARTAAFIVDFAEGWEVPLPAMPETQREMLQELMARVAEETRNRGSGDAESSRLRAVFLRGFGGGAVAERLREEANTWFAENWGFVAMAAAGFGLIGMEALAIAALAAFANRRRAGGADDVLVEPSEAHASEPEWTEQVSATI